jgi:hypothetical protein
MNSKTSKLVQSRSLLRLVAFGLMVMVVSSGCARLPWKQPVDAGRQEAVREVIDEMRRAEASRSACIDADLKIFFTSTVANRAISGYMQLMQPAQIKFVTSNPLGQPLVVFVSDGQRVQFVNTMQTLFTDGNLADFVRVYEIPPVAFASDWSRWLTGRLPRALEITALREDQQGRGIWVSIAAETSTDSSSMTALREHVLIDPAKKLVIGRLYTDRSGSDIEATIGYDNWLAERDGGELVQPGTITITDLDYSGQLELTFSALQASGQCRPASFELRQPPGYQYQPLPTR